MFIPQLFISSSIDWDLGGFHFLAFVNSATIAFVYYSFWVSVFKSFGYVSRSGIDGIDGIVW